MTIVIRDEDIVLVGSQRGDLEAVRSNKDFSEKFALVASPIGDGKFVMRLHSIGENNCVVFNSLIGWIAGYSYQENGSRDYLNPTQPAPAVA